MTDSVLRLVTAGSTNLTPFPQGQRNLKGLAIVNTAAYAIFVKLYWFLPTASASGPTVGTTPVAITYQIPATSGLTVHYEQGITRPGNLFLAVTKLAADSDTTAVLAADGLVSAFYE